MTGFPNSHLVALGAHQLWGAYLLPSVSHMSMVHALPWPLCFSQRFHVCRKPPPELGMQHLFASPHTAFPNSSCGTMTSHWLRH